MITRHHLSTGQRVEQGGLAGIGIAHEGDYRERHPPPGETMEPAGAANLLQFLFQPHDAIADQTTVGLDLGLARATQEAKAAALPLQVGPRTHQA